MGMMIDLADPSVTNPLDFVEAFIDANEWASERTGEDELALVVTGKWCDFNVWVSWRPEIGGLHFACVFGNKFPTGTHPELHSLLVLANEKLSVGHFDLWAEEQLLLFRHTLLLGRDAELELEPLEMLFEIAFSECERFYPAVQLVLWGGKPARDAIEAAMMDCVGEA